MFIGLWLLGGFVTFVGALCYAELGSSRPSAGGEYQFLKEAYGPSVSVLFAWARCSVIQPGAIAAVAFVLGDYANVLLPLGPYGPAIYAVIGVHRDHRHQLRRHPAGQADPARAGAADGRGGAGRRGRGLPGARDVRAAAGTPRDFAWGAAGLAMVFILLTYGGWNEAAYLSGEFKDVKRNMVRALMLGVAVIVVLYLLINFAYLHVLGLEGSAQEQRRRRRPDEDRRRQHGAHHPEHRSSASPRRPRSTARSSPARARTMRSAAT